MSFGIGHIDIATNINSQTSRAAYAGKSGHDSSWCYLSYPTVPCITNIDVAASI